MFLTLFVVWIISSEKLKSYLETIDQDLNEIFTSCILNQLYYHIMDQFKLYSCCCKFLLIILIILIILRTESLNYKFKIR